MTTMRQMLTEAGCDLSQVEWYYLRSSDRTEVVKSGSNIANVAEDLDRSFDDGFGCFEGPVILVYTPEKVFFSCCYDGAEWVASVPRNPGGCPVPEIHGGQ